MPNMVRSLLGLTAIQHLKRVKGAAGLTPKRGFVAAEPIEREIRQVCQSQKTACEIGEATDFTPPFSSPPAAGVITF
jgi:hypothetical protein